MFWIVRILVRVVEFIDYIDNVYIFVYSWFVCVIMRFVCLFWNWIVFIESWDVDFLWFLFYCFLCLDFVDFWFYVKYYLSEGVVVGEFKELFVFFVGLVVVVVRWWGFVGWVIGCWVVCLLVLFVVVVIFRVYKNWIVIFFIFVFFVIVVFIVSFFVIIGWVFIVIFFVFFFDRGGLFYWYNDWSW